MMLPLATKQSGGKLLPHSDLRGGVFLGEASRKLRETLTWSKFQLEEPILVVPQLVKKLSSFNETRRFTSVFTAARNLRLL
jgi:hypothetical protein